jgi:hypothetical protein
VKLVGARLRHSGHHTCQQHSCLPSVTENDSKTENKTRSQNQAEKIVSNLDCGIVVIDLLHKQNMICVASVQVTVTKFVLVLLIISLCTVTALSESPYTKRYLIPLAYTVKL